MEKNKVLRVCYFVYFMIFTTQFCVSLDPGKKITQYIHEVWGIEQNLPQNTIETIIQTKEGYLWLGTQEGLVRFDGLKFTVFDKSKVEQLFHNKIMALCQDRDENIWIGTYGGGVTVYNLKKGTFRSFTEQEGLSDNLVLCIFEDREGNIWIGTDGGGLSLFTGGKFTVYNANKGLSHNRVTSINQDNEGVMWFGTENGLNRFKDNKFSVFTTSRGLSHNKINTIFSDKRGNLWIGTYGGGLNVFNPIDETFTVYTTKNGLCCSIVNAIIEDREGNIWAGTKGKGLCRIQQNSSGNLEYASYSESDGLSSNNVRSIFEDREGSLWVGTLGGGINRLKDGKFTAYTTQEGLSNNITWSVHEDNQGYIWIGTYGGINRLHPQDGKITVYSTTDGVSNRQVRCIYKDSTGALWAGTDGGGLNLMKNTDTGNPKLTILTTEQGLADDIVNAIYEDRDRIIWIGTNGGLNRLKHRKGKIVFETFSRGQGLSNNIIKCIYKDRGGNLWVGTEDGLNVLKEGKFSRFSMNDGLSSNIIRCIYEDEDGILWFGTRGGLSRLEDGKFTHISTKDGLYNDTILHIFEDDNGFLWMSSNKGIFKIRKKELNDFSQGKNNKVHSISYDEKDGMKSRECNGSTQPSGWKSRDGRLWFPTIKGVVVIDPDNIKINRLPPQVEIEKIVVDNIKYTSPFSLERNQMVFSPGKERFEIHYTGLSLLVPQRVRFLYKLEGYDKEWLNVGTRRVAYYTNLPPRSYTFRVKACNNDGIWSETGASLSIYLKPFFYQSVWFYVVSIAGLLILAFGIFRFRVRQITHRKAELERQVAERTHQLEEFNKELEKLSIVARETDNAITIMDEKGNLEWINEGFTRKYEYTLEQLIEEKGRNLLDVSAHPNIEKLFSQFLKERKSISYEASSQSRSGKKIWAQTTLTPILDNQGRFIRVVAIDTDISKIKESEQQIREQNERILYQTQELEAAFEIAAREREIAKAANQAKSEFLARMSHEIRTPMNGIIGFADMIVDTDLSEEQLDYIQTIRRSGAQLIELLNDILDLSKIEAGELSIIPMDFDPEITVFDVVEIILPRLSGKYVEMLCQIGDDVPAFVKGDAGRFRQVLINLLGNAAKFTTEGEIELSLKVEAEKENKVKLHITVRDTGIGIPDSKLKLIFDPFQQADGSTTREYGGTGLGLSISKQIAKLMGGDVWAESTPGKGSIFHFTSWMEKSKKELEKRDKDVPEVMEGKRALILDDNLNNLKIVAHLLERAGMQSVQMTDPSKVVSEIKQARLEGNPIDICIIDIRMPKLSGYDVARQIRNLQFPMSSIPLLAYSSSMAYRVGDYKDSGFDGFLPKPVHGKKLVDVVARLLSESKIPKTKPAEKKDKKGEIITRHTIAEEAKHSISILLAEDNPINQKLAQFMLTKAGYRLKIANNGKEVLEILFSDPHRFDLIFMDVQMPQMDGLEAAKTIREKGFKDIPIIAMTAQSMKGDREKCLEAGMNDYISKPIKREVVFSMVKKWCLNKK